MGNLPVKYGLMAGGISIVFSVILYLLNDGVYLRFNIIPQYVIEIYFMAYVVSIIKERNNGFISFNEAFKSSWLTYILAASIISVFTYILMNFIDPGLIEKLKEMQVEAFELTSKWLKLNEEDKEKQLEILRTTNPYDLKSIAALPVSFLFPGAIIAVVISLIKRKDINPKNV